MLYKEFSLHLRKYRFRVARFKYRVGGYEGFVNSARGFSPNRNRTDLKPTFKRQRASCGDSLLVVVESVGPGRGNSIVETAILPLCMSGKKGEVRIGVYVRQEK